MNSNLKGPQPQEDVNKIYFHKLSDEGTFFGAMLDGKYEGLGVLHDSAMKIVTEAGMYSEGKLLGYGIKIEKGYSR